MPFQERSTGLHLAGFLCLLAALLTAPVARAAAEHDALAELYRIARLMDAANLDLNMLLGEEQAPTYKVRIDETLRQLDQESSRINETLGSGIIPAETLRTITDLLKSYTSLARANRDSTIRNGYPEGAVLDEMMLKRRQARAAIDPVYRDLEKKAGLAGSPLSEARALALILQNMSALYVETAASAGGVSYRSQDSSEEAIDSLARKFDKRLGELASKARDKEAVERVRSIQTKWRFIEKSMLNYREKTVPYLVDRYTQLIVSDLMSLADLLTVR